MEQSENLENFCEKPKIKEDRQYTYNVKYNRVPATIVGVDKH